MRRIEVTPGVTVPEEFSYAVSPPDVPITATVHIRIVDGVATCHRAEVERHDGQHLTAVDIRRVAFGQLVSEAPQVAAMTQGGPIDVGDRVPKPYAGVDEGALDRVRHATAVKGGIPVSLEEVARVYRRALRDSESPTAAVAEAFSLSERTASRRVADARKAGHLGAALNRRGGEALTSLEVSRSTSWDVGGHSADGPSSRP